MRQDNREAQAKERERQAQAQEGHVTAADPYQDPEGRALVQAIHDRTNNT